MSIPTNSHCISCLLNKHLANARSLGSSEQAYAFGKAIMEQFLQAQPGDCSALMGQKINRLYMQFYGLPHDRFQEEKDFSNRFVMQRLAQIRQRIDRSDDPVFTALEYAILGNYIDFSALGKTVSFEALDEMLLSPEKYAVDPLSYQNLCQDLSKARSVLYLTDNAGEIGFDRLLAECIQKHYPQVQITFCVRGKPAHNDATREDAQFVGLPFPVIDHGTDLGGFSFDQISQEAQEAFDRADVILSKGMGNTESLYGCGYPIYYAFLIKCPRLEEFFQKPFMTPMLVKDPSYSKNQPKL